VLSLRDRKEEIPHDARILGREEFVTKVWEESEKKLRRQFKIGERKRSIDQLIKGFCEKERINESELRNGGQRRTVSNARARLAHHLSREWGISSAEIARNVGVCATAVMKAIERYEKRIEKL
jgi:hypothetical protein